MPWTLTDSVALVGNSELNKTPGTPPASMCLLYRRSPPPEIPFGDSAVWGRSRSAHAVDRCIMERHVQWACVPMRVRKASTFSVKPRTSAGGDDLGRHCDHGPGQRSGSQTFSNSTAISDARSETARVLAILGGGGPGRGREMWKSHS